MDDPPVQMLALSAFHRTPPPLVIAHPSSHVIRGAGIAIESAVLCITHDLEEANLETTSMKNKIYPTFDEAVADIPDGSVFMSPGFGG
jgi:hypothetical protein